MNILFISDNIKSFQTLEIEFSLNEYVLEKVSSEEEIEEKISSASLVILDLEFSNGSDVDFIKTIRDNTLEKKSIPIICAAKTDELKVRMEAFNNGADEFVEIFDKKSLLMKVNSFLKPDLLWKGLKTLLVEDDKISAKFISHVLKSKGAQVKHFLDAVEAYEYIKENPGLDLILTDHIMPNLTGIDFVKKIRREIGLKSVPIVFISSIQNKVEVLEFYKAGGNDYLSKPLIKEELYVKVNQLLENRIKSEILHKQVEELEKLSRVKDQFLAVCSHDLRTPLNTIMGLSNLIIEDEEVDEDVGEYVKQIDSSAKDLLEMVNELLDFSEIQIRTKEITLTKLDLSELLRTCVRKMNVINTKQLAINHLSLGESFYINGNRNMLTRAINNVLNNAYKFTPDNGMINIQLWAEEENVYISIKDSGIGIPKESQDKLFDEMSGIGRVGLHGEKSIGLGMSIVKKIIDQHSGTIEVNSEENKGTEIIFGFKLENE